MNAISRIRADSMIVEASRGSLPSVPAGDPGGSFAHAAALMERKAGIGERKRFLVQGGVAASDVLLTYFSFLAACLLHGVSLSHPTLDFAVLLAGFCLIAALFAGAYDKAVMVRPVISAVHAVRSLLYGAAAIILILFATKAAHDVSRVAFTLGAILASVSVALSRLVWGIQVRAAARGGVERTLLIEDGRSCRDMDWTRRADAGLMNIRPDADDPGMMDRIGKLAHRMDRVVVNCPGSRKKAWAAVLKALDARGEIIDECIDQLGVIGAGRAGPHGTLVVAVHPLPIHSRIIKRGFDIGFAAIALLCAAPVFAIIALAILIEDGRPIFFRQIRVGQGNRAFAMLKFRSMRVEQSDFSAMRLTIRGDARVTRVGRLIRATSLDELPQLVNVLFGKMSIVGPRPHAAMAKAGDKLYWQVDRRYWERHALKPGLTGLAQVRGHRGATDHEDHLRDRLQADLEYLQGWSIWRDLRIVAATARVVVHPQAF